MRKGSRSNTGAFQNRSSLRADAVWTLGRHTVSFGASYSYTQLNTIDKRTGTGTVATDDLQRVRAGLCHAGQHVDRRSMSVRSCRAMRAAIIARTSWEPIVQDKFQVTPNLSLTAGVRYDWDGGLTEKYGRIFNFDFPNPNNASDPNAYQYDAVTDTITQPGFIIAGNNTNGTKGVSKTTLTGRQWGIAPRLGAAWQPAMFHSKVVVRDGLRHVLRPRRTVQLLLAGLRDRHGDGRTLRREPAAAVCDRAELPGEEPLFLLHPHLRR